MRLQQQLGKTKTKTKKVWHTTWETWGNFQTNNTDVPVKKPFTVKNLILISTVFVG